MFNGDELIFDSNYLETDEEWIRFIIPIESYLCQAVTVCVDAPLEGSVWDLVLNGCDFSNYFATGTQGYRCLPDVVIPSEICVFGGQFLNGTYSALFVGQGYEWRQLVSVSPETYNRVFLDTINNRWTIISPNGAVAYYNTGGLTNPAPPLAGWTSPFGQLPAPFVSYGACPEPSPTPSPDLPCGEELDFRRTGTFFPVPFIDEIILGNVLGEVRVTGSMFSAPDRIIFSIDNQIVLDTLYRGSSSYQAVVNTAHTNAGLPLPPPIIQCNSCGVPGDENTHGRYDFKFTKTSTTPTLRFSAFSPVQEQFNAWRFIASCPTTVPDSLFGYNLSGVVGISSIFSTVAPVYDPRLIVTNMVRPTYTGPVPGTGIEQAGSYGAYNSWSSRRLDSPDISTALTRNKAYTWTVRAASTSDTVILTGCTGFVFSRTNTGPVSAALLYRIDSGPYNQIANVSVPSTTTDVGCFTCSEVINQSLNANPITIPPNSIMEFALVPYEAGSSLGIFRIFDYELLGKGEDIAFFGRIV